ncbi:M50 family metallopeptidase [candidate division KSB1 bacterium]|nr:M50 family metallopeptidase [candidate division KSB1 bacterium]
MKQLLILFSVIIAIFFLWSTPALYPLKLLIVFFHESSHALMTIATGGQVIELEIDRMQGGHVISAGGNRFITLTAGYLGSLIWGVVIYLLAVGSKYDKAIMFCLGIIIMAVTTLFVRDLFAFGFGGLTGLFMILMGVKAPMQINDIILRVIGVTSMSYVPLDVYSDTIVRTSLRSDAFMLAEEFGGTTVLWGTIWLLVSVVILIATLKISLKFSPVTEAKS